jgi:hypothetical protein
MFHKLGSTIHSSALSPKFCFGSGSSVLSFCSYPAVLVRFILLLAFGVFSPTPGLGDEVREGYDGHITAKVLARS